MLSGYVRGLGILLLEDQGDGTESEALRAGEAMKFLQ
jgi:hypothetical protein